MRLPRDWEILSQKKDVEGIKQILEETAERKETFLKKGVLSLIISILSSFIASFLSTLILEHWEDVPFWYYIIIVFVVCIVTVIPFFGDIKRFLTRGDTPKTQDIMDEVNLFDNDIIYNIMLSNSYYDLYKTSAEASYEKNFYISESKYYIRKVLHQLSTIRSHALCENITDCGFGIKKRVLKERVITTIKFVRNLVLDMKDTELEKETNEKINDIITTLGIDKTSIEN